jgi:hypothetical protein
MPLQYVAGITLTSVFDTEAEAQEWLDSVNPAEAVEVEDSWIEEQFPVPQSSEPVLGMAVGPVNLFNVHAAELCAGRSCVIHNPSDHHMRDWPMNWRADRHMMERVCPHGVGHPDPDEAAYQKIKAAQTVVGYGQEVRTDGDVGVHGCDGCCRS